MTKKPICIYHGGCADGFTAAWAVWKRFGDSFDYHAGVHQNAPPDVSGRDVVIVDFSYKLPILQEMLKSGDENQANTILILDHHKSAEEDLRPLMAPGKGYRDRDASYDPDSWRRAFEEAMEWPVRAVFDMERSGAGLAWDYFHPGTERPAIVHYVEDRDLWRFELEDSRDINAYIFAHPYDFNEWERLAGLLDINPFGCASMGAAIEKKHHKDVAELVSEMRRELRIAGHIVPAANLPKTLTSDAGHVMCKPYPAPSSQGETITPPFAACYWDTPDGRVFSLRSHGDFDVSAVARQYGGGGHKNAAGFRVPFERIGEFEVF